MSDQDEDEVRRIERAPQAHSVRVFFCLNPECRRPHVVLYDERGKPIAHFVVPDPKPGGFIENLKNAMYRSAVERMDDRDGG